MNMEPLPLFRVDPLKRFAIRSMGRRKGWMLVFKKPRNKHWYYFSHFRFFKDAESEAKRAAKVFSVPKVERLDYNFLPV